MEERELGRTGAPVARIGQGTWELEHGPEDAVRTALHRGLDAGMTHVDTAELYGGGEVERILGRLLRGRRDEVFLASKVLPENASRDGVVAACEGSLRRLRTDRLDLYLLHWAGEHPLEDTIAGFEALVEAGKTRFWGVSNFDADELRAAVELAGPGRVACDQVLYHLAERAVEHRVLPACAELGVALVGYSPFGRDAFPRGDSPEGRVLARVAERHGATSRQVALAFVTRHPGTFAVPKAARPLHVEENAGAGDLALEPDDVAELERTFPLGPDRPGIPWA